jgi:branched-chain amino acid transport system permease protein
MRRIALVAAFGALLLAAPAALAQSEDGGESIGGTLKETSGDEPRPVAGVTIIVRQDGVEMGRAASDEAGRWSVPVPGPAFYEVEILAETLPDGIVLRDPEKTILPDVEVRAGQAKTVIFPFGEGATGERGAAERLLNLMARGLTFGVIVALTSIGLSLIFGITGLVNFAHGELVTFGAIAAWFFNASGAGPGWHLLLAVVPALLLAGGLGGALELGLFKPLRRRNAGTVSLIVVSIGLSLFMRHIILLFAGGAPHPYAQYALQAEWSLGPISLPPKDLAIIAIGLAVLGATGLALKYTRWGTAMRSVADNKDLAEASGIDVEQVILRTWVLGTALAGLGGILWGITQTVRWNMGFTLLLTVFAAVILGGIGTAFGAVAGGILIGITTEASTFWIDVELKFVVALAVLIVVLLVRPQGIFGVKERVG